MKTNVRLPKQERSIEKKNKIIQAGYELFSEVGYYGTNTAEIAKKAGVSTGVVYCYFKDKRDIILAVLDLYMNKVADPLLELLYKVDLPIDFSTLIPVILDETIKAHKKNNKIHEALHALSSTDEAVNAKFIDLEDAITLKFAERLKELKIAVKNVNEKIHFAMDIIQSFAHEYIYDKHSYIDYDVMRDMVINTLVNLFEN